MKKLRTADVVDEQKCRREKMQRLHAGDSRLHEPRLLLLLFPVVVFDQRVGSQVQGQNAAEHAFVNL